MPRIPLTLGMNSDAPEEKAVPVPLVAPIMVLLLRIWW